MAVKHREPYCKTVTAGSQQESDVSRLFNVRCPPWLLDLIDEAVAVSGAKDKSAWGRDALEYAARRELAEKRREEQARQTAAGVHLGGGFLVTGECTHPPTARRRNAQIEWCGVCRVTLKHLL